MRRLQRTARGSRRRASAFVEFAVGLAVLSPVLVGAGQYGWSLYLLHELEASVERGAEAGCTASGEGWEESIRQAAVDRGRSAGLRKEQVRVTVSSDEFEVSVTGYTLPVPLGPVALEGKPAARFPICRK